VIHIFGTLTIEDVRKEFKAIDKLQRDGGRKNIVEVLRHGELSYMSLYYIDMELCDLNLIDYINGQQSSMVNIDLEASRSAKLYIPSTLKFAMILEIMKNIADGLAFIHFSEVIHRDLKPPNGNFSVDISLILSPVFRSSSNVENCRFRFDGRGDVETPYNHCGRDGNSQLPRARTHSRSRLCLHEQGRYLGSGLHILRITLLSESVRGGLRSARILVDIGNARRSRYKSNFRERYNLERGDESNHPEDVA